MKTKTILLCLVLATLAQITNAQTFDWARQFSGDDDCDGTGVITDDAGNIYITGTFKGTHDFDPSSGVFNLISENSTSAYVAKLDASGNLLWAKKIGGTDDVLAQSINIDNLGNLVICGNFKGTLSFIINGTDYELICGGNEDGFVAKLDASGNLIWLKQFEGSSSSIAHCISIGTDAAGNIYTVGDFTGVVDFDSSEDSFELTLPTNSIVAVFICKLDSSGNFIWAKKIAPAFLFNESVYSSSIAVEPEGNVYFSTLFLGTIDFDPGSESFYFTASPGYNSCITKLNAQGDFVWAKQIYGMVDVALNDLSLDAGGNIYAVGSFNSLAFFNPEPDSFSFTSFGNADGFVAKYDTNGNFLWATQIKAFDSHCFTKSCTVDLAGNVYVIGNFSGTVDFPTTTPLDLGLSSGDGMDSFVAKIDGNGYFLWVKKFDLLYYDQTHIIASSSITTDNTGNIYTVGLFKGGVNFDTELDDYILYSPFHFSAFVHKLSQSLVGFNENNIANQMHIYPNPSSGEFNILFEEEMTDITVYVRNVMGQKILEQHYASVKQVGLWIDDVAGVYFIELLSNNQTATMKVIKQ